MDFYRKLTRESRDLAVEFSQRYIMTRSQRELLTSLWPLPRQERKYFTDSNALSDVAEYDAGIYDSQQAIVTSSRPSRISKVLAVEIVQCSKKE